MFYTRFPFSSYSLRTILSDADHWLTLVEPKPAVYSHSSLRVTTLQWFRIITILVSNFVELDQVFETLNHQHVDLQVLETFLEDEPPVLKNTRVIGYSNCVFRRLHSWLDSEGDWFLEFAKSPANSPHLKFVAFLYFRISANAPEDTPATLVAYSSSHLNGKRLYFQFAQVNCRLWAIDLLRMMWPEICCDRRFHSSFGFGCLSHTSFCTFQSTVQVLIPS